MTLFRPIAGLAAVAAALIVVGAPGAPAAQTGPGAATQAVAEAERGFGKASLRQRQGELFSQLQADPSNLALMFAYAAVSARLEDVEQAIATFERMLIYRSDLKRVRLELGALYFRIGSYETAKRYLLSIDAAEGDPLPPALQTRARQFLSAIEERTARNRFAGVITAGAIYSSNANFGPDSAAVLAGGQSALIEADAVEDDDVGARVSGRLRHSYDLGGPRPNAWETELSGFSLRYADTPEGDAFAVALRTGPKLSLDDDLNGLKARPFAEIAHLNVGRDPAYLAYGSGVEANKVLGDQWYAFGEVKTQYREYFDGRNENDGFFSRAAAGAAFSPSSDLAFNFLAAVEREGARVDFEQSTEGFVRFSTVYKYNPGFGFVDRRWAASGFVRVGVREFDAPDPGVDPSESRTDVDVAAGVEHDFALRRGLSFVLDADYLFRDSDIPNFDLDNVTVGASVRYKF